METQPRVPGTLLIVDDEINHLGALCDTLSDHGYQPVGCRSAEEALNELRRREFDILLTDLQMPEMDGIALLRAALEIRPGLTGVLMTGHGTIDSAVEAMKVGALDYILKPFRLSTALPVLQRALEVKRLRIANAALENNLSERARELEIANADLDAFSSSVAHDLRGPLGTIGGYAQILLMDFGPDLPGDAMEMLRRIDADVRHMSDMIRGLLQFSRLGRQAVVKEALDLSEMVREVVWSLHEQNGGRVVEVQVADLPACAGDPLLIRQVLVNLLSNAFKFTRQADPAMIEVGYRNVEGQTAYFVRDNGAGFDMTHANRLFGMFQRLHRSEQFEGTGIGLSSVQRIITRHDGKIWAEAAVGQGATFYFTLPDLREATN